jgi:hypothetical protein
VLFVEVESLRKSRKKSTLEMSHVANVRNVGYHVVIPWLWRSISVKVVGRKAVMATERRAYPFNGSMPRGPRDNPAIEAENFLKIGIRQ